ncbi:hybrid sensor histidine kinase/response regulator transcription factor [Coprobacter sp.]
MQKIRTGIFGLEQRGGGLNRLDRLSGNITSYKRNHRSDSPGSNLIKKLYYHPIYGKLYAGLYRGGFNEIDTHTGKVCRYRLPNPLRPTQNLDVYDFEILNDSLVLVIDKERGIFICNIQGGTSRSLFPDKKFKFYSLYKTRDGLLWLAGQQGITVIDPHTRKIVKYYDNRSEKGRLSGNNVYTICQTVTGDVWIGTRGDGVTVISPRGSVTYYNRKNGLDADIVYSILEDAEFHDLWLTTDNGMFHYVTSSKEFVRFDLPDAFASGSFYPNAQYKTTSGELLFGHTNGFLWIEPSQIKINRNKASVYLTGLYVNNIKIEPGTDSPLKRDISTTDKIILDASDTNIAFSFASSNYLYPSKNQFACRLKGVDDNWRILAPGEYKAYFSGLSAGRYIFEVKAANNNGIWNNDSVTSIEVVKKASIWFTWYAFVVYFLILSLLFYWLWRNSSRFRRLLLQLSKEQEQRMRIQRMTEKKVSFFTNISHELRAPLSVMNDLLIRMRPGLKDDKESEGLLGQMQSQVVRVNNLLDQLLDIQTIEDNSLVVNCYRGDSVSFFRMLCSNYENMVVGYDISVTFKTDLTSATFLFDPVIWEKIIGNLFINLFHYLPSGGNLIFSLEEPNPLYLEKIDYPVSEGKKNLSLQISGENILLSLDEANALFYRFYSESENISAGNSDSQLGLALVKKLLSLLQGNVFYTYVERKLEFNIVFPVESARMSAINFEEFDNSSYSYSYTTHLLSGLCPSGMDKEETGQMEKKKYSILIVEGDPVLRDYLTGILSSEFWVIAEKDGKNALVTALREKISVVLTEILIPGIDGFELCRQLKSNPTTSNIPVIILSSLLSKEDKWSGMNSGADLYIEKPFDSALLIRQIQNLIRTLETQRMIYGKTLVPTPTPVSIESADNLFLQRALALVEKNIDDPSYDVENFVLDMAMSRSLLYKKIKSLTGHSVKTFILEIKLKRAVQLLTDTDLNVSEVSDRVGFTEPRYFGTCFKKRFGMTPSEFLKEKRKK